MKPLPVQTTATSRKFESVVHAWRHNSKDTDFANNSKNNNNNNNASIDLTSWLQNQPARGYKKLQEGDSEEGIEYQRLLYPTVLSTTSPFSLSAALATSNREDDDSTYHLGLALLSPMIAGDSSKANSAGDQRLLYPTPLSNTSPFSLSAAALETSNSEDEDDSTYHFGLALLSPIAGDSKANSAGDQRLLYPTSLSTTSPFSLSAADLESSNNEEDDSTYHFGLAHLSPIAGDSKANSDRLQA